MMRSNRSVGRNLAVWIVLAVIWVFMVPVQASADGECADTLDYTFQKLHSKDSIDLCQTAGSKPTLIVNTASHCGFTGQFESLEALHNRYKDSGLVIVGFPSNDFKQEASSQEQTAKVCYVNYGVTFSMTAPISVTGQGAHPLFKHLGEQKGFPRWNFHKYLVDRDGNVVKGFRSNVDPLSDEMIRAVESVL